MLNNNGGVIDDCIITKHGEDEYYMVTNAGCREKDVKFIKDEAANLIVLITIRLKNIISYSRS